MVPIGIILLVVGVILLIMQVMAVRTAARLRGTQRSTVGDLQKLVGGVAGELGGGSFRQAVAVVGRITSDAPLTSPMGQKACVYFRAWVERRYEEDDWQTDTQGNRRRVTRTGSENVSDQSERRDFLLDDGTGQLLVVAEGARFEETYETVDRFDPEQTGGATLTIGGFSLTLPVAGGARRTIGYEYHEQVVPVGQQVTVTGEVTDAGGQLALRGGQTPLTVSTRSFEEQLSGAEKKARFRRIAGIVCAAAGVVLLIVGLVTA